MSVQAFSSRVFLKFCQQSSASVIETTVQNFGVAELIFLSDFSRLPIRPFSILFGLSVVSFLVCMADLKMGVSLEGLYE